MSRLCDRVPRRVSPGLDTDLSGLGLGFIYPGNVRRRGLFPGHAFQAARVTLLSLTGQQGRDVDSSLAVSIRRKTSEALT